MPSTNSTGRVPGDTSYALGVDIGGTFTDFALVNQSTGKISVDKVLTDTGDVSRGVMTGFHKILEKTGVASDDVHVFVHNQM